MGVWETETLANLCNMYQPKTISKKDMTDDGDYPVYGANGIIGRYNSYNHDSPQLLVGCRGTCGSVYITSGKVWINGNAMVIAPKDERLVLSYLEYFFRGAIDLSKVISGAAQPQITRQGLSPVTVDYPPIPEQQRIVAILDQAFANIEKARANAEKNLKNILELYLSYKQKIFGRSNLESQMMDLTSVCEDIFAGGDAPKKGLYSKVKTDKYKIPIYANAVKDAGLYGFTDYFRVDKPSITIAARGSGTGHIELRRDSFLPIVRLIVLIPRTGILSLEYFKYALQNLDILRSGSAIPQLTVPMIKEYCIPVPSLDTQLAIIEEIDRVGGYIEECKRLYEQKLQSLEELKKSLLQKAFSGELTKTEGHAA